VISRIALLLLLDVHHFFSNLLTLIGTIQQIWRHPVKSMAGEKLNNCMVESTGIPGDRGWALRDETTGEIAIRPTIDATRRARASLAVWAGFKVFDPCCRNSQVSVR
jgi:uncharacterized protein YcbX